MIWQKYNKDEKTVMLQQVAEKKGIIEQAVEKDWWVTVVLKALSNTSWGNGVLLFKGGTSLSKGWNLIERFSEDIDLAVDRQFFNKPDKTKHQRKVIRKLTYNYIKDILTHELDKQLRELGVTGYEIEPDPNNNSSAMVTVLNVKYESILETVIDFVLPEIKIEFSCMAMKDPFEEVDLDSFIHHEFEEVDKELSCTFPTVIPERTFLEKMFLLNEEFQRDNPRHERMARHLYDIEKIINTDFAKRALEDTTLYEEIVKHRKEFYNLNSVDYNRHHPSLIDFCPPSEQIDKWRSDYEKLESSFIYGKYPTFNELIVKLQTFIKEKIRPIQMKSPLITE
ncbi:nucleotidyl transferase AbiEii/AbiGii toxin family protein [Parabacteroides sp. OttesenSCG-928-G21]|nr:nucleotidyl transferase AbiEii/AbiGii toxin family protein [Parabacteroides sp. OttesenSCG-928-G21]